MINTDAERGKAIMQEIWAIRVHNASGIIDEEFLDGEPKDSLIEGLQECILRGEIISFEIRMGYLNGGDSRIEYALSATDA